MENQTDDMPERTVRMNTPTETLPKAPPPPEDAPERTVRMTLPKYDEEETAKTEKTIPTKASLLTELFHTRSQTAISIYSTTKEGITQTNIPEEFTKTEESLRDVHEDYEEGIKFAEGGQGILKRSYDLHFERQVAMKSLRPELRDNERARHAFLRESVLTAHLEHPSIVPVYGLYNDLENGLHLAMKMVHGKTLKSYLKTLCKQYSSMSKKEIRFNERTMLSQRLDFFLRVCDSISFLHHKHIIHRDLKPENIMIGEFNETYIMDLGIAEKDSTPFDPNAAPSGTIQYIAPEVICRKPYDHRSDIFLLGLVLYEIVCLRMAYTQDNSLSDAITNAGTANILPIEHQFGVPLDSDLVHIVRKALMRSPDDRYQSASALAADVKAYLEHNVVSANPHVFFSNVRVFITRHVRMMLGAMLIVLLLFMSTMAYTLFHEYQLAETMRIEDMALTNIYAKGILAGSELDAQFTCYETSVAAIAAEIGIRLESAADPSADPEIFVHSVDGDSAKAPKSAVYSTTYHGKISPEYITWITQDSDRRKMDETFRKFAPMLPVFAKLLAEGNYIPGSAVSTELPLEKIRSGEITSFRKVFFSMADGDYFSYPFSVNYKSDMNPKVRPWYLNALENKGNSPIWSHPYQDITGMGLTITCSKSVHSRKDGHLLGVVGADISLESLAAMIREPFAGNKDIENNMLVDNAGKVVIDVCNEQEILQGNLPEMIFNRMQKLGSGRLYNVENGIRYLYFFMKIETLDWYYVQKIDFNKRIQLLRTHGGNMYGVDVIRAKTPKAE